MEIEYDSFSLSPIYTLGNFLNEDNKGISLRFPWFKWIWDDKDSKSSNSG